MKNNDISDIFERALARRAEALNEHESKRIVAAFGVPVVDEYLVDNANDAVVAAGRLGYPVAMKACAARLTHKTESGLVVVGIADADAVRAAFDDLTARAGGHIDGILVQPLVRGRRELLLGLTRAPGFGPCVTLGMGGVFAEVMRDVAVRVAPVSRADALDMIDQLRGAPVAVDALVILDPDGGAA